LSSIALVGGFDAGNYGDALFPVLARAALRRRLGARVRLTEYGFSDLAPGTRPYAVRDLRHLPGEIGGHDLLLLGGGGIVRGDPFGPAFAPASPEVEDPYGMWLEPMLEARRAGVPVAFNAPGVSPTIAPEQGRTAAHVLADVRHLVVRDRQSAAWLAERTGVEAAVVPDSAFGLAGARREPPGAEASAILTGAGIGGAYVILQPAPELVPWRESVATVLEAVSALGLDVLELPIGPVLGDRAGLLGELPAPTRAAPRWPGPQAIAQLVANAAGAIGMSLHLGITAVAFGVPLFRPPSPPGHKYERLEALPGVFVFARDRGPLEFGARAPSGAVLELRAQVEAHWDAVAVLASADGAPRGARRAAA
jgi:lipopolysaccharide transport system ATP-binding protein